MTEKWKAALAEIDRRRVESDRHDPDAEVADGGRNPYEIAINHLYDAPGGVEDFIANVRPPSAAALRDKVNLIARHFSNIAGKHLDAIHADLIHLEQEAAGLWRA